MKRLKKQNETAKKSKKAKNKGATQSACWVDGEDEDENTKRKIPQRKQGQLICQMMMMFHV